MDSSPIIRAFVFSFATFLALVLIPLESQSQQILRIKLIVDSDNLRVDPNNLENSCYFELKGGLGTLQELKEYTVEVEKGDIVFWEAESINGQDQIKVSKIKYLRGKNTFGFFRFKLRPETGNFSVARIVKRAKREKISYYTYALSFQVVRSDGTVSEPFIIDPKLRIKPRRQQ